MYTCTEDCKGRVLCDVVNYGSCFGKAYDNIVASNKSHETSQSIHFVGSSADTFGERGLTTFAMAQCRAGDGFLLQQSSLKGRPVACYHAGLAARGRVQSIRRSGRSLCATVRAEKVLIINTKGAHPKAT